MLVDDSWSELAPASATPEVAPAARCAGKRVLVVEDDEVLSRFLNRILRMEGIDVEIAHSGDAALPLLRPELDAVILDLNLPGMDGISVLQELRTSFSSLAVLVLTARARSESAVLALENGADDCLTKPFSYVELLARLRALFRRHGAQDTRRIRCGSLMLDKDEFRVTREDRKVELTPREYSLLEFLLRSPGIPVPRAVLLKELWGEENSSASNVVDVYMKYLRDKVDLPGLPKLIRTVRGVGYAISAS